MLASIRDDTLNVLNTQHITQIQKDGIIQTSPTLVQIMACRLVGAKPLSEEMLEYH